MNTEWTTKQNKDKNCTTCKHGHPFKVSEGVAVSNFYECDLNEKHECASWPEHRTCEQWSSREVTA